MPTFGVSLEKRRELKKKMFDLGVKESDLKETFIRSPGRGGQNVNKVSSCVHLYHYPTGILIKCHQERAQSLNRFIARETLLKKIEHRERKSERAKIHQKEKLRRQKQKRTSKLKEEMLKEKHRRSQKKEDRKKIKIHKLTLE